MRQTSENIGEPLPIFIVGSARSGTTMLGEILTSAKVGKSFEGHFVVKVLQKYGDVSLTTQQLDEVLSLIEGFESMQHFGIKLCARDYTNKKSIHAKEIISDVLCSIAKANDTKRWIEKTPSYVYHLPLILKHFPEAKVIWMVRDGRDVAHSVFQKSWGPNNTLAAARGWNNANSEPLDKLYRQVIKVKYEEFLSQPHQEMTRILKFLGHDTQNIKSFVMGVDPSKMNRWRKNLSIRQIQVFESVAFESLKMHKYATQYEQKPDIPKVWILAYKIDNYGKLAKHLINENLFKPLKIKLGLLKPFSEKN